MTSSFMDLQHSYLFLWHFPLDLYLVHYILSPCVLLFQDELESMEKSFSAKSGKHTLNLEHSCGTK